MTIKRVPPTLQLVSRLIPHMTFAAYLTTPATAGSVAVARAVADLPGYAGNPLLLHGEVGTGKTHLLHAIGHATLTERPETRLAVISAECFSSGLVQAIRQECQEHFLRQFLDLDLLLLDDFSFLAGKEATQAELLTIMSQMVTARRQVVIAATEVPSASERHRYLPELVALLQGGTSLEIAPPQQLTPAMIVAKSRQLGLELPDQVVELFATATITSFRVLEGLIVSLHAHASLCDVPISLAKALDYLGVFGVTGGQDNSIAAPDEARSDSHDEGFAQEARLKAIYAQVTQVQEHLTPWGDFMAVARLINPELCTGAFERRPCRRQLRYIGYADWPEPTRSEMNAERHDHFVHGEIYTSTDFNGATYSIAGWSEGEGGRVIGSAYFEWVRD